MKFKNIKEGYLYRLYNEAQYEIITEVLEIRNMNGCLKVFFRDIDVPNHLAPGEWGDYIEALPGYFSILEELKKEDYPEYFL